MSNLFTAVAVIALFVLMWSLLSYNRFVSQRTLVQSSWSQVDVELQRRYDLIPNLVSTAKGYADFERSTLESLTAARNTAVGAAAASPAARRGPEDALAGAVRSLLAVAEAYPDLKASVNFLQVQEELTRTEDRLSAARRFYNGNVSSYNTRILTAPSSIVANLFGFTAAEFFEADGAARTAPSVT